MGVGAREPRAAEGGAGLTLAERAPLLRGGSGGRRLRKHGRVYEAAELPGADPPPKPAGQRDQVTDSVASSPGTARPQPRPFSGGSDSPLLA